MGLMSDKYKHRNGETETPTKNGWYVFDGEHRNAVFAGKLYERGVGETGYVLVGGDIYHRFVWDGDRHQPIDDYVGRWWGPMPTPWTSPAPRQEVNE